MLEAADGLRAFGTDEGGTRKPSVDARRGGDCCVNANQERERRLTPIIALLRSTFHQRMRSRPPSSEGLW